MKKILLSLLLLLSAAIMSYSQNGVIRLTTRYLYDYSDQRAYSYKVLFEFENTKLTIIEEDNRTNISGTYRIIEYKPIYDNELGRMLRFLVEKNSSLPNTPPKQYILTQCEDCMYFMPRTDVYTPERYVYLFNNPDI